MLKMKKYSLQLALILGLMIFALGVNPASAKAPTPILAEYDVQLTYFSPYNSEYKLDDPLIVDKSIDLLFLEAMRSSTKLDLGKSVWESTFSTITGNSAYSLTMGNATWDTATSDGMTVNTQATCNAPETLVSFKATTNGTAVAQYAQTISYFSYDSNGDGDYVDTADKSYLPHDENIHILVNNEMTCEGTDAQTYTQVDVVLETTTSQDYTISIKYWYTAGDSGWDFTTGNGATLEFFDVSGIPIVAGLDVAAILDADSESVNILGTDYLKQYLYEDVASEYVQNEVKNIAYFTAIPAFTDATDGNNDWDMDGDDEYFSGIDQTDYLFTVVTQAGTDAYDNSQELLADHSGSITTITPARYLYFTGAMAVYPTSGSNWDSAFVSQGKYLTKETLTFDTREINTLKTLANVLSVSTWKMNMTLEDAIMWDTDHYENNLVTFTDQGIDQVETLRPAWTVTTDDSEVTYDNSDPSTTTGDLDSYYLEYYTASDLGSQDVTTTDSDSGSGPTSGSTDFGFEAVIVVVIILAGVTGFYLWKRD